jgi:two-component system LytT family response regulator
MKPKITAIIAEDEPGDRELFIKLLEKYEDINIVSLPKNISETRNAILNFKPDIAFLDIELYGENVFNALDKIKEYNLNPYIVFVTAYNNYAIKAFKYAAVDYLEKPVDIKDLDDCITKIRIDYQNKSNINHKLEILSKAYKKIIISDINKYLFIDISDIVYVEAEKGQSYTNIILASGKIEVVSKGIGEIEKEILPAGFIKIHRSLTINPKHINMIDKRTKVLIIGNHKINLSSKKINELKNKLENIEF